MLIGDIGWAFDRKQPSVAQSTGTGNSSESMEPRMLLDDYHVPRPMKLGLAPVTAVHTSPPGVGRNGLGHRVGGSGGIMRGDVDAGRWDKLNV